MGEKLETTFPLTQALQTHGVGIRVLDLGNS